jgi:hypothetical protein
MPQPLESSTSRLIVEGADDQWTIINAMKARGFLGFDLADGPFVTNARNTERAIETFGVALKEMAYRRLAVVFDANGELEPRTQSISNLLSASGLTPIATIAAGGLSLVDPRNSDRRIGVWVWPDNVSAGCLEHVVLQLAPANPCFSFAEQAATEARTNHGAPCRQKDHPKSVLHTFLAWQKEPGVPYGRAIEQGVLHGTHPSLDAFARWFSGIFG